MAALRWLVSLTVAGLYPVVATATTPPPPTCQATYPGGPLFITPNCIDPEYTHPYVDIDAPGTTTDPATGVTVQYRYIHGGFTGTNTLFAFYFPSERHYRDRFFEWTYPLPLQNPAEAAPSSTIAFAISNGAYVVSSNNNGGVPAGGVLAGYRANAAAANFSRVKAAQIYRRHPRPRGYLYGASGGAYQVLGAAENTSDVWDGTIPMVPAVPNAIPSFQSSQVLASDILGSVGAQIADAVAPGGSGDPFTGLTPTQSAALQEVTKLGFPLGGWWQYANINGGSFSIVAATVEAADPGYLNDFWTQSGYEGVDPAVQARRVEQFNTTVASNPGSNTLVLANVPSGYLINATLAVASGPSAGQQFFINNVSGNTVQLSAGFGGIGGGSTDGITADTAVTIDNSWVIALEYYQRHSVPTPDQYGWNQYRDADGNPIYAQRPFLVGPLLTASTTGGAIPNGHFYGKMIMLASDLDIQAYSWSADWYKGQASAAQGSNFGNNFRLWYMENADHTDPLPGPANDHIVPYIGEAQQALLDLDAWVRIGIPAPASTNYVMDTSNHAVLAPNPKFRHGVQPVVTLSAGGKSRVDVAVGQTVIFSMEAQSPGFNAGGPINRVEWDFQDTGNFVPGMPIWPSFSIHQQASFTFTQPGTYFPTVRVWSQRVPQLLTRSPFGMVPNIASVRVVVK